jgi:Family of unknown function (DUF5397)
MGLRAMASTVDVPVGMIKTFGPVGPKYIVGPVTASLPDGDWEIEVTVLETGEVSPYRLSWMNDDPVAA